MQVNLGTTLARNAAAAVRGFDDAQSLVALRATEHQPRARSEPTRGQPGAGATLKIEISISW